MIHVDEMTSGGTSFEGMDEFFHMKTFLRLAYMYHVMRIPLKEVPCDVISSTQRINVTYMYLDR